MYNRIYELGEANSFHRKYVKVKSFQELTDLFCSPPPHLSEFMFLRPQAHVLFLKKVTCYITTYNLWRGRKSQWGGGAKFNRSEFTKM